MTQNSRCCRCRSSVFRQIAWWIVNSVPRNRVRALWTDGLRAGSSARSISFCSFAVQLNGSDFTERIRDSFRGGSRRMDLWFSLGSSPAVFLRRAATDPLPAITDWIRAGGGDLLAVPSAPGSDGCHGLDARGVFAGQIATCDFR